MLEFGNFTSSAAVYEPAPAWLGCDRLPGCSPLQHTCTRDVDQARNPLYNWSVMYLIDGGLRHMLLMHDMHGCLNPPTEWLTYDPQHLASDHWMTTTKRSSIAAQSGGPTPFSMNRGCSF